MYSKVTFHKFLQNLSRGCCRLWKLVPFVAEAFKSFRGFKVKSPSCAECT